MPFTRRQFAQMLQAGAALSVAGFGTESLAAASAVDSVPAGLTSAGARPFPGRAEFAPLVGSDFQVASLPGAGKLTLLAVEEVRYARARVSGNKRNTPQVECSLLRFAGNGLHLAEGTHKLAHPTLGEIFLDLSLGKPGRYLAKLAQVPPGFLQAVDIPRRLAPPVTAA